MRSSITSGRALSRSARLRLFIFVDQTRPAAPVVIDEEYRYGSVLIFFFLICVLISYRSFLTCSPSFQHAWGITKPLYYYP